MAQQIPDTAETHNAAETSDIPEIPDTAETSDAAARQSIESDLDSTLFVQAGAGTGKTTALVNRILALIASGVEIKHIAAITFTEKAAAELQARIRRKLQEKVESASAETDSPAAVSSSRSNFTALQLYEKALADLDNAAVSTLHSFAQRILTEHALDADLPLQFEVFEPVASVIDFAESWERFHADCLLDDNHAQAFLLADTMEIRSDWLKNVAASFRDNWDLLETCSRKSFPPLGKIPLESEDQTDEDCDKVISYLEWLIADFTLEQAILRKTQGQMIFHDLLVLARDLLADAQRGASVRASLHNRYKFLLIDEFQDTDPIQIELAVRIASAVDQPQTNGRSRWQDHEIETGRLFFVGDPKQSIYRFRRADISLYLEAAQRFGSTDGQTLGLTANWRSTEPLISWVNNVFGSLISSAEGSQSQYEPLEAMRKPIADDPGPSIALIGAEAHKRIPKLDESGNPEKYKSGKKKGQPKFKKQSMPYIRGAEAHDIACVIRQIADEEWLVGQKSAEGYDTRPAQLNDICILIPKRTGLPILETALSKAGIPYRVEVSNQIFSAPEIRDLLAVLFAIDDPADELMITTALRSPAFGCGDDDLFAYRLKGGKWDYLNPRPADDSENRLVANALEWLRQMHRERNLLTPSQVVEKVVRERNLLELALTDKNYRDIWRRLRFIGSLARQFTDQTGGTLRQFLQWLRRLGEDKMKLEETIVPESDYNAVRIMTVHAAKGLEFPIVILADMASQMAERKTNGGVVWNSSGQPGIYFKKDLASEAYRDFAEAHQTFSHHENIRKLYVACTRAKDHLVVSLHRNEPDPNDNSAAGSAAEPKTWAETLHSVLPAMNDHSQAFDFSDVSDFAVSPANDFRELGSAEQLEGSEGATREISTGEDNAEGGTARRKITWKDRAQWQAERDRITAASQKRRAFSASEISKMNGSSTAAPVETGLNTTSPVTADPSTEEISEPEDDLSKDPDETHGSHKGRGASEFGKAVHEVLQSCDIAVLNPDDPSTAETLSRLTEAHAGTFGIHDETRKAEISRIAQMALRADIIREVSAREHLKEIYAAAPLGDNKLVYGYIDLVFQDGNGNLAIIDYKTVKNLDAFRESRDKHRRQMAAYAVALEESAGLSVSRCVLVVLPVKGDKASEDEISGEELEAAKRDVKSALVNP